MIDFFYSLPIWLATILILALSLTVGLASSFGLRKLLRLRKQIDGPRTDLSDVVTFVYYPFDASVTKWSMNAEQARIEQNDSRAQRWHLWGPYLSDRQWGNGARGL